MSTNLSPRPIRRGFSLVELLVVIGIIGVLIAILVPTVSRMRATANAANSQQVLSTLASAIERYHADFRAYPGVFSNDSIGSQHYLIPTTASTILTGVTYTSPTAAPVAVAGGVRITQSENLVLSLAGGLNLNRTAAVPFTYDAQYLTRGPVLLNANVAPKTYPPYIEANESRFGPKPYKAYGTTDTDIPEFLDGFGGEPMPVIYLRARQGAQGVIDTTGTLQFDSNELTRYGIAIDAADFPQDPDHTPPWWLAGVQSYFINSKLTTGATDAQQVPAQKDTYVLISAGKDRKYGTTDDICNFSPVK